MASQCVNCGAEVTNETSGTIAPACDHCRSQWLAREIDRATRLLTGQGYTVIPPAARKAI